MTGYYLILAVVILAMAFHGLMVRANLLRKLMALNIFTSAVFLFLVTLARMAEPLDPIPHAMVLTGIVVTVSTTAVGLALLVRLYRRSGSLTLDSSNDD
ncbi:MAG: NADH-quinone oxidoreductase subunit NuoK [Desulfovibrionales bacterium]|uniref:sodium:proton antiporter n=1 Tax=Desulfonatronum thioautotrophicum TaxID=617001 RepID=UPI0005EB7400|nr:cation:proton antiporter subunit C [Desulfonatronum thioautotrophicum]TVQ98898.1 MAG: NADH-quinone oxidoreductase subunit NuoK [Desulfovibrionales bacterium]